MRTLSQLLLSISVLLCCGACTSAADKSFDLYKQYRDGDGVEKNLDKAKEFLFKAADQGSPDAMHFIGDNYNEGDEGFPKDLKIARKWFETGAQHGSAHCFKHLGEMYLEGIGGDKNVEKGLEYYRKASELNIPAAQSELGKIYEQGIYTKKDLARARKLYQLAADQDYARAQNQLAYFIAKGLDGSKPDFTAAFTLDLKAAKQGLPESQYNVGRALDLGIGVKQDKKAARDWYEAAVKQGNPHACNNLANMYFDGTTPGIKRDLKEGMRLRLKAAELGCPIAQCNLGADYERGEHFEKDMSKAVYWYKKSANQDYDLALYQVGQLYMFGIGVPQDLKIARTYLVKAAELKNEKAQLRLKQLQEGSPAQSPLKAAKPAKTSHR